MEGNVYLIRRAEIEISLTQAWKREANLLEIIVFVYSSLISQLRVTTRQGIGMNVEKYYDNMNYYSLSTNNVYILYGLCFDDTNNLFTLQTWTILVDC